MLPSGTDRDFALATFFATLKPNKPPRGARDRDQVWSRLLEIGGDELLHFADGGLEADEDGAGDDGVADV